MEMDIGMEKPYEEINQDKTNLLQAILEETTDTIFIKDLQGRYLLVNKVGARNFGKSPEELIGKDNAVLDFPPETKKEIEESDRRVIQTGETLTYEIKVSIEGEMRTFLSTKSPYRDQVGKIIGVIGITRDITDRKLAEETLRAEHAYRKPIEEAMLAGVVAMANVTCEMIYVNPAFCKIVGWREQEMLGLTPPFPFWPPEEIENITRILKSRFLTDSPPEIEIRFQRRNGERFPVLIKSAPLTDGHGNKIGLVSTIGDISNQKLSEARLRESLNLLNSIVEGTSDAIYLRDLEGHYLMVNSSTATLLGKSPDEIIGKHMSEFFSPEMVRFFEELGHRILNTGKIETSEDKLTINGISRFFLTTRGPIRNHEGNISGFFGISRDITEKKLTEEILQKSEERLAAIIDNSTTVIYMKDLSGKFVLINKKFKDVFHISRKDVIGKTCNDFFPLNISNELHANDQKVITEKHPIEFDETVPQEDGPHDYLSIRFPLLDNKGEVYAVCGVSTDMTDRKGREEDHIKIEKLESLGLLAGGIAHDFNNILTAILGNISLSKSLADSKDQLLSRLNEAERATLRASDLAQQLLTFSKGGVPIKKLISIRSLFEHSVQFALTGSNIQSQLFFQEDLWPIEADKGQMNQVIQNLIINAKQAMPSGGTIQIEVKNLSIEEQMGQNLGLRQGHYLAITIQDQGTGIPKELLSKIFDPYFTTKTKGSGLGLSISHSIIKRHQGYITAESNPGGGTSFFIYLPAAPQSSVPQETFEAEKMTRGKGRVLVMDDEESVLNIAKETLIHLGYEVDLAKNGSEAVKLYETARNSGHPFDVVMTDLTVPGDIGGVETLRLLREIDPQVKVIVSSGYSNDPAMADFKSFGFSDCLKKPYRAFEMGQTVKRVLGMRRLGD
ncbi:MAG: PAS domain S-box protein [Nitrospirae bacterium]|nr:PAS domain S-box protein [Nitrospirota bacterium]